MKLSATILAGFARAEVETSSFTQQLDRLLQFSDEILYSGAFDHKSLRWKNMWSAKFRNNSSRMQQTFITKPCGFQKIR